MEKLTHRAITATARAEIRRLKKPDGMRTGTWRDIQDLLCVLAGYLPEVWPSQRTLAEKLGCSQPTVHRRVSTAVRHGLITTTFHQNEGWMDGLAYHLVCLSEGLKATCSRYGSRFTSASEVVLPSTKEEGVVPPLRGVTPGAACGGADQTARAPRQILEDVLMGSRWDPESEPDAIGADPFAPFPGSVVKPVDPAVRLAALFDECWKRAASKHSHLRTIKPSHRPKTIQWLSGVMLKQVDEDVAEAYIRQFPRLVVEGAVNIGRAQTAFQAFTGTWGTVEEIDDPVTSGEDKTRAAANVERYREFLRQQAEVDDDL